MSGADCDIVAFGERHLDGAHALAQQCQWPHRPQDIEFVAKFSDGIAIMSQDRMIGMALCTPFGGKATGLSMIMVDKAWRGQGLGKRLLAGVLQLAGGCESRLFATTDGQPLYENAGFVAAGRVVQHQGMIKLPADRGAPIRHVDWAAEHDMSVIAAMDHHATGLDRSAILSEIARRGRFAVFSDPRDSYNGFAAIRDFGRGMVVGPVVADSRLGAQELIRFLLSEQNGEFCRIDAYAEQGLTRYLESCGLQEVDSVVPMIRNQACSNDIKEVQTYTLISQALG